MNLHAIVAGAIGSVNAHEMITLYRCTGTTNTHGTVSVTYDDSDVRAQVQAPTAADLRLFDHLADARHVKRFYLDAPAATVNRFDETAGDIIARADGSYWLIERIIDDFSPEGWLCVIAVLQHEPPEGIEPDEPVEPDEPAEPEGGDPDA